MLLIKFYIKIDEPNFETFKLIPFLDVSYQSNKIVIRGLKYIKMRKPRIQKQANMKKISTNKEYNKSIRSKELIKYGKILDCSSINEFSY